MQHPRTLKPPPDKERNVCMTKSSTPQTAAVAVQDANVVDICRGRPVGLVLHAHGALRLFEDPHSGDLFAEVNGMRSDAARHFLSLLDGLADISAEILVSDRPEEYPLEPGEVPVRAMHMRRHA